MANIYIKTELEKKLKSICDSQEITVTDFVNDTLERQISGVDNLPTKIDGNDLTIEKLILHLLEFTERDQKRFLALYDQYTCDIKGQPQMLERLKKA